MAASSGLFVEGEVEVVHFLEWISDLQATQVMAINIYLFCTHSSDAKRILKFKEKEED